MNWNDRHATLGPYEASWNNDAPARALELNWLYHRLLIFQAGRRVVEIGCGGYTLDEHHNLHRMIRAREYDGFDVSPAAIKGAQERYPDLRFHVHDCQDPTKLPEADFVICRRVLQNLPWRQALLDYVLRQPHGVVFEGTYRGFRAYNKIFQQTAHPQEFNYPLDDTEARRLDERASERGMPLAQYYRVSRVLQVAPHQRVCALVESLNAQGPSVCPMEAWAW